MTNGHGYYNLAGEFVKTATLEEATAAWRTERGYSTGAQTTTPTTPAANLAQTFIDRSAEVTARPGASTASTTSFVRRPVEPVTPSLPPWWGQPTGGGVEPVVAQPGFVRRPAIPPTITPPVSVAPTSLNLARREEPRVTSVAPTSINVAQLARDERRYVLPQFQAPQAPDLEQRRYTLPRFGERRVEFDNVLEHRQLIEAARLTGEAMFVYGQLPSVISTDVARELPYNPTSKLFQDVMFESFGVPGFDTPEEFLARLGYIEFAPGQWEIQDPITVTGYGDGAYQGGGTSPYSGVRYSAARGYGSDYGYRTGSTLVNWRI